MSRFLDYWKLAQEVVVGLPQGAPRESPACAPPVAARYRGAHIWIHPLEDASSDSPFVTDDGRTFLPDDAIANVQLERYVPRESTEARKTELLKRIYY